MNAYKRLDGETMRLALSMVNGQWKHTVAEVAQMTGRTRGAIYSIRRNYDPVDTA